MLYWSKFASCSSGVFISLSNDCVLLSVYYYVFIFQVRLFTTVRIKAHAAAGIHAALWKAIPVHANKPCVFHRDHNPVTALLSFPPESQLITTPELLITINHSRDRLPISVSHLITINASLQRIPRQTSNVKTFSRLPILSYHTASLKTNLMFSHL